MGLQAGPGWGWSACRPCGWSSATRASVRGLDSSTLVGSARNRTHQVANPDRAARPVYCKNRASIGT
jgi:hypothetical protein